MYHSFAVTAKSQDGTTKSLTAHGIITEDFVFSDMARKGYTDIHVTDVTDSFTSVTPAIYAEQWTLDDAANSDHSDPAPFGDKTWRVVDDSKGGVVAYFNSQLDADLFVLSHE